MTASNGTQAAIDEAKLATEQEPIAPIILPLTPDERIKACQADIKAALARHGCVLVPSWLPLSPTQQVRSENVEIQALADWKAD